MAPPLLVQEVNTETEWLKLLQIEVHTQLTYFRSQPPVPNFISWNQFYNASAYTSGFTEILQKKKPRERQFANST